MVSPCLRAVRKSCIWHCWGSFSYCWVKWKQDILLNVYSTHREYRPRENISFLENGTKIYALNPKSFVFVPEKSAGNPEVDIVRTVNIPFVVRHFLTHALNMALFSQLYCDIKHSLITKVTVTWFIAKRNASHYCFYFCPQAVMNELNSYSFILRSLVSMYINSLGVEIFLTRTVHEVLWGFKDPLLSKIHNLKPEVDEHFGLMWNVSSYAGSTMRKLHVVSSYQSNRQVQVPVILA